MHSEILQSQQRLGHLFEQARLLLDNEAVDEEVRVQFVWYLCVRTCGFVEWSVQRILMRYVESSSSNQPIQDFIDTRSRNITPNRDGILRLVGDFSSEWQNELRQLIQNEKSASLTNMVRNRHQIAHGRDVDLTYLQLKGYFDDAQSIVQMVYDVCDSTAVTNSNGE